MNKIDDLDNIIKEKFNRRNNKHHFTTLSNSAKQFQSGPTLKKCNTRNSEANMQRPEMSSNNLDSVQMTTKVQFTRKTDEQTRKNQPHMISLHDKCLLILLSKFLPEATKYSTIL